MLAQPVRRDLLHLSSGTALCTPELRRLRLAEPLGGGLLVLRRRKLASECNGSGFVTAVRK